MGNNVCTPCVDICGDDYVPDITDSPAIIELQSGRRSSRSDDDTTSPYKNCNEIVLIFANGCSIPGQLQIDIQKQILIMNVHKKIHNLKFDEISHVVHKESSHTLQKHEQKLLEDPKVVVLSLLPSSKALAIAFSCEDEAKIFSKVITDAKETKL